MFSKYDLNIINELVFCGYGEPLERLYDICELIDYLKKDFIFVIAVFLILLVIFADISVYEAFGSVRSRKLEAQNLAVMCAAEIEQSCYHTFQLNGIIASTVISFLLGLIAPFAFIDFMRRSF